jgi:hypothetical protein
MSFPLLEALGAIATTHVEENDSELNGCREQNKPTQSHTDYRVDAYVTPRQSLAHERTQC